MLTRRGIFASLLALPGLRMLGKKAAPPKPTVAAIPPIVEWESAPGDYPDTITIYNADPGAWLEMKPGDRKDIGNGLVAVHAWDRIVIEQAVP